MKRKVLCLLMLLVMLLPVVCFADTWYCPLCGQENDGNYCVADGTARPTITSFSSTDMPSQDLGASARRVSPCTMMGDGSDGV